jgi:putative ABC transport system permease protein
MSLRKNLQAALQVVRALPMRNGLLALPVAASVGLALATLAIDHGLTAKAEEAKASFGADNISIRSGSKNIAGKTGGVPNLTKDDVEALRSGLHGIKAVEGTRNQKDVTVSAGTATHRYAVFAVRPGWAQVRHFGAEKGRFISDEEADAGAKVCVIGQTVARELFPNQDPIGRDVHFGAVAFKVIGVLVAKGSSPAEGDRDARIVMPLDAFLKLYPERLHLDQIVVQVKDTSAKAFAKVDEEIKTILRREHRIAAGQLDDFVVRLPERIAHESRGLSRDVFYLMLGLALVCGGVAVLVLGVVSGQAVRSRQSEIGIRRALGASATDILQQFWTEGLVVCLLGGLLGAVLGLAGAWAMANWRQLAFGFDGLVIAVPLAIVLLASLVGLLPARAAAALAPADALRGRL